MLQGCGWGREVVQLLHFGTEPEARSPLKTSVSLLPIAGDPTLAGRYIAPTSTYPHEVVMIFAPFVVARNPGDVVSLRLYFRRNLIDWRRWFFRNHRLRLRVGDGLDCEGLMNWPATQHFKLFIFGPGIRIGSIEDGGISTGRRRRGLIAVRRLKIATPLKWILGRGYLIPAATGPSTHEQR